MTDEDEKPQYRKPEDHGYWDGGTFHFTPPITVMSHDGPREMHKITLAESASAFGVEPYDIIHALLNPIEGAADRELREIAEGR